MRPGQVLSMLLVGAAGGCGLIGFDPRAARDAPDPAAIDAADCLPAPALPRPDPVVQFAPPVGIDLLNDPAAGDDDPSLTSDRLSVWFHSTRAAGGIFAASRPGLDSSWSTPAQVAELTIPGVNTPKVSPDGLRMSLSAPGLAADADLFQSIRASTGAQWPAPTRLAELSSPDGETGMAEFLGGYGVVFFSDRAGGLGGGDLWMAERTAFGCAFGPPAPVAGGVNTAGLEANPWVSYDGLVLVWQSDRTGGPGNGDLWWASRAAITDGFGPASLVPSVNSGAVDDDPWLSEDLRTIVFVSARTGNTELYLASSP